MKNNKDSWENALRQYEGRKLIAETEYLHEQIRVSRSWQEKLKSVAGVAGVLTAIVALAGLWLSFEASRQDRETRMQSERLEAINRSIELATATGARQQLAGITELDGFINSTEEQGEKRRLLLLLTNLLAVEESKIVRDVLLRSLELHANNQSVRHETLLAIAKQLRSHNRSLSTLGSLSDRRQSYSAKSASLRARAAGVGQALSLVSRVTTPFSDYSGIYCESCDFSGRDDLAEADFSDSVLIDADFHGASLRNTKFVNSNITGADFREADLEGADFSQEDWSAALGWVNAKDDNRVPYAARSPDFSCANLQNSNFHGRALWIVVRDQRVRTLGVDFRGSDLAGAKLKETVVVTIAKDANKLGGIGYRPVSGTHDKFASEVGRFDFFSDSAFSQLVSRADRFERYLVGSHWHEADLPQIARDILSKSRKFQLSMYRDLDCVPQRPTYGIYLNQRGDGYTLHGSLERFPRYPDYDVLRELISWKRKLDMPRRSEIEDEFFNLYKIHNMLKYDWGGLQEMYHKGRLDVVHYGYESDVNEAAKKIKSLGVDWEEVSDYAAMNEIRNNAPKDVHGAWNKASITVNEMLRKNRVRLREKLVEEFASELNKSVN